MQPFLPTALAVVMASALGTALKSCVKNSDAVIKNSDSIVTPSTAGRAVRQGVRSWNNEEENQ